MKTLVERGKIQANKRHQCLLDGNHSPTAAITESGLKTNSPLPTSTSMVAAVTDWKPIRLMAAARMVGERIFGYRSIVFGRGSGGSDSNDC